MPIPRPYHRICRAFESGDSSERRYVLMKGYANSPEHYVRAFLTILKDTRELFDSIEPADTNLKCYSFRTHEILMRACIEVEANCKAILMENTFTPAPKRDMRIDLDYSKIEKSHHLSSYEVRFPFWKGAQALRRPFEPWATGKALPWYQAYNKTKHDRHNAFEQATFAQMTDAVAGLFVLLSAQFWNFDFRPCSNTYGDEGPNDGMEDGIGDYLRVKFPKDWAPDEQYQFKCANLEVSPAPFQRFDYDNTTPAQTG